MHFPTSLRVLAMSALGISGYVNAKLIPTVTLAAGASELTPPPTTTTFVARQETTSSCGTSSPCSSGSSCVSFTGPLTSEQCINTDIPRCLTSTSVTVHQAMTTITVGPGDGCAEDSYYTASVCPCYLACRAAFSGYRTCGPIPTSTF
ncbi:hypothetical protein EYR38_008880 [Pleurotus pulmonarius]|nr:hypothetical protein EYR38_008880 [Pleurotus pulmonarius]